MKKAKSKLLFERRQKNHNGETAISAKNYLGNLYSTFSTSKYILQER
ncbi:hypothetical protein J2W95_003538 [Flavobacterium granuli]|uniref:Uncharacterized protein n=1 Tax=Flavobacterium granuli TaxID=280093 RepID=A0ABU1S9B1_9FLAO|nr:hypothetical protein [Flavobacterium granuli]